MTLFERNVGDDLSPFSEDEQLAVDRFVSESLRCKLFKYYIQLHDNLVPEVAFVELQTKRIKFLDESLRCFLRNPAKEGGCSVFAVTDERGDVLLSAFYEPGFQVRVECFERVT